MAAGGEEGYDLDFVDTVPDALICLICTCAAKEAHQVTCCGRVFCKGCLGKLVTNSCPQCRKEYKSFQDMKSKQNVTIKITPEGLLLKFGCIYSIHTIFN